MLNRGGFDGRKSVVLRSNSPLEAQHKYEYVWRNGKEELQEGLEATQLFRMPRFEKVG